MTLDCCGKCTKYTLFAFNLLCWLGGVLLLIIGIYTRANGDFSKMTESIENINLIYAGSYITIVLGIILFVVGFCGCCGAMRESKCLLLIYFITLSVLLLACLTVGIWVACSLYRTNDIMGDVIDEFVDKANNNDTQAMDTIHSTFKCCGSTLGQEDFTLVPESCKPEYNNTPCAKKMMGVIAAQVRIISASCLILVAVMIMGMVMSMYLVCAIDKEKISSVAPVKA